MFVLALHIDLRFPSSQSLKEKRRLAKPIIDGLRSRLQVSVSEIAHQDSWQRCELGVALVGGDAATVEHVADQVERFVWRAGDTEVLSIERHWLEIDK